MGVTVESSGTQTATIGTEHTLFDTASAATRTLFVDVTNLASGDALELHIYKMAKSAGTRLSVYKTLITGAQPTDDLGRISVPISTGLTDSGAIRFTLKQTLGTGRNFDWTVEKFA
jgi:hypothetical protein